MNRVRDSRRGAPSQAAGPSRPCRGWCVQPAVRRRRPSLGHSSLRPSRPRSEALPELLGSRVALGQPPAKGRPGSAGPPGASPRGGKTSVGLGFPPLGGFPAALIFPAVFLGEASGGRIGGGLVGGAHSIFPRPPLPPRRRLH